MFSSSIVEKVKTKSMLSVLLPLLLNLRSWIVFIGFTITEELLQVKHLYWQNEFKTASNFSYGVLSITVNQVMVVRFRDSFDVLKLFLVYPFKHRGKQSSNKLLRHNYLLQKPVRNSVCSESVSF